MLFDDSYPSHNNQMENHLNRPEGTESHKTVATDMMYAVLKTTGVPIYSATHYKDYIVRSAGWALPYNVSLINNLQADLHYLWFTVIRPYFHDIFLPNSPTNWGLLYSSVNLRCMTGTSLSKWLCNRLPQRTGRNITAHHSTFANDQQTVALHWTKESPSNHTKGLVYLLKIKRLCQQSSLIQTWLTQPETTRKKLTSANCRDYLFINKNQQERLEENENCHHQ